MTNALFPMIPAALEHDLYRQNPWWRGDPAPALPPFRRWPFEKLMSRLRQPIAAILVIRGPRQIGKTTLQQQVVAQLLSDGVSRNKSSAFSLMTCLHWPRWKPKKNPSCGWWIGSNTTF